MEWLTLARPSPIMRTTLAHLAPKGLDRSSRARDEPSLYWSRTIMMYSLRWALLPGVLLAGLVPLASSADAPDVRDAGGFFTPATVRQANDDLAALKKQFKVDLVIDSVSSVPPDKVKQVQAMKPAERNQFFANWALER